MKKWIIIPDVHGRTFWREAIEGLSGQESEPENKRHEWNEGDKVVFLGDYVDPYPWEGILPEDALKGLEEIIDLKKEHPDKVVLLLGNHDLGYLEPEICTCRRDSFRAGKLKRLFEENLDLFDLVHIATILGRKVLFSHAGIAENWVRRRQDIVGTDGQEFRPERLNEMLHGSPAEREALFLALADVSWPRGGNEPVGCPVWADVDEYLLGEPLLPSYYHIFGHTYQLYGPVHVGSQGVCVDCRKEYVVNS